MVYNTYVVWHYSMLSSNLKCLSVMLVGISCLYSKRAGIYIAQCADVFCGCTPVHIVRCPLRKYTILSILIRKPIFNACYSCCYSTLSACSQINCIPVLAQVTTNSPQLHLIHLTPLHHPENIFHLHHHSPKQCLPKT